MSVDYEGWKGWALEIETFFVPWNGNEEASAIWAKKSRFPGHTPSHAPSNGFARLKIIIYTLHIKNRYISNFMYMRSFARSCFSVEVC
jgi:hypothetical protein